jgi:hypothetical protein
MKTLQPDLTIIQLPQAISMLIQWVVQLRVFLQRWAVLLIRVVLLFSDSKHRCINSHDGDEDGGLANYGSDVRLDCIRLEVHVFHMQRLLQYHIIKITTRNVTKITNVFFFFC